MSRIASVTLAALPWKGGVVGVGKAGPRLIIKRSKRCIRRACEVRERLEAGGPRALAVGGGHDHWWFSYLRFRLVLRDWARLETQSSAAISVDSANSSSSGDTLAYADVETAQLRIVLRHREVIIKKVKDLVNLACRPCRSRDQV